VVIHSRDAEEDTIKVLESHQNVGGVLHCFSGSLEFMRKGVELGFYISYSGNITFKNAQSLREVVSKTPTYRLLIETDSPWLAPVPHRGEKNKPSFIWHTAKVMSELIPNSSLEDIDRTTSANAKLCFNLGFDKNEDTITYVINNKLYINPTNKCNLHCRFCERERDRNFMVKGYWVWTRRDPSADDIIREIPNPEIYDEIVFCGYGEPTLRMDVIKKVSSYIKSKSPNTKVRVDTNGLYLAFGKKEDLENLRGLVDTFSISLNAPDENTYNEVCRPPYKNAFSLLIEFIKTVKELGFEVITTAVTYPGVDIDATEKLALELGTKFRKREWEVLG
jgi:Mg-dependent DNase